MKRFRESVLKQAVILYTIIVAFTLYSCGSSSNSNPGATQQPAPALPVIIVKSMPATTSQEFVTSLEGIRDIEIRPQADGYLDRIFIEEGAFVKKGQLLFRINSQPYREQLNSANAAYLSAIAEQENTALDVNRLTPLVQNNVISDVQLKSAQAAFNAAKARVAQAKAEVQTAKINLGYTTITAPVNGYIGRIPFKEGSLVGKNSAEALTDLSETKSIHAYFSMSETDFLQFKDQFPGNTIQEKIKQMPGVELLLADNSIYPREGKVELAEGRFSRTAGTINFRAVFPNGQGLLRSGNTGRIRISRQVENSLIIPQEATFELQDKVFVFALADSNKVLSKPITIAGKSGNYYLVKAGVKPGEKIVYTGLDRLRDGVVIQPTLISIDSLLRKKPL